MSLYKDFDLLTAKQYSFPPENKIEQEGTKKFLDINMDNFLPFTKDFPAEETEWSSYKSRFVSLGITK